MVCIKHHLFPIQTHIYILSGDRLKVIGDSELGFLNLFVSQSIKMHDCYTHSLREGGPAHSRPLPRFKFSISFFGAAAHL